MKLRRPEPLDLPDRWRLDDGHTESKVEGDWTGRSHQVSASAKAEVDGRFIGLAGTGPPLPSELFSRAQRHFFEAVTSPVRMKLTALRALGPILAWQWRSGTHDGMEPEVAAQQWAVGELGFLELSIRVPFPAAEAQQSAFSSWVTDHGFAPTAVQTTKTESVLEHFAGQFQH